MGWRAWRLSLRKDHIRLTPIGKGPPWPVRREAVASCFLHRRHRAPELGCTCGIYAARDAELLREARSPAVIGEVILWGRVAEHRLGWRAALAYPATIRLVCHVCLFMRGVDEARPDVVAWYRNGDLVPLCDDHWRVARACGQGGSDAISSEDVLYELARSYRTQAVA